MQSEIAREGQRACSDRDDEVVLGDLLGDLREHRWHDVRFDCEDQHVARARDGAVVCRRHHTKRLQLLQRLCRRVAAVNLGNADAR